MKKYIAIILAATFLFLCFGCTNKNDFPTISASEVESIHVWAEGTYNEIQLNTHEMKTFIKLYNKSEYKGEGTGNGGTPEWGVFVCYKNGSEMYINEFNGRNLDFELSLHTASGQEAWCYINNQELMKFIQEKVEKME